MMIELGYHQDVVLCGSTLPVEVGDWNSQFEI